MRCKRLNVTNVSKLFDANEKSKDFIVKEKVKRYGVAYCIRYRPLGLLEWILARGWWNDRGIRTPYGKFKD